MSRFKEWNAKLLSLTPEEFEDLCYELIEAQGFINLKWIKGGKDRGRDIIAEKIEPKPGFTTVISKWVFQCKRYGKGIPVDKLSSAIEWAATEKTDYFVVMSNSYLTTECREYVEKRQAQTQLKIFEWTNKTFQKILFSYPHIVESFFPGEKIPDAGKIVQPQKIFEVSIPIPQEVNRELKEEFVKLIHLEEKERNKRMFEIIKEKVIDSEYVDSNVRALIYQQLSVISSNRGDLKEAISYLDKALEISPKNRTVIMNKAFLLDRMKRHDESARFYDKALKLNTADKVAWNGKGHCLERLHKHKSAMYNLKKAIEIDSKFILARDNIGGLLVKQHKYLEALDVFDKTLKLFPNSKTTLNKKANVLKDLKDYREAYKLVNKSLEIDPYFVDALNNKGVILEHNGQYQHSEKYTMLALETFERVIGLDNKFVLGHTNRIACLVNLSRIEEALEYANETVGKFPDEELAWMKKGHVLGYLKRYNEALKCVRKALKINKYHKGSLIKEGIIYIETGKFKRALKVANELIKLYPRYDYGWRLKGDAFEGLGRVDKAQKYYKRMKELEIPVKNLIEE